jgi:hypothetical protein
MDQEGKHGAEMDDHDHDLSLHTCPQPPYLPSLDEGKHEGKHGDVDYVPTATADPVFVTEAQLVDGKPPGQIAANGYAISATPEDRKPLEPGQLAARVWIKEIRHPAIKSGPDDSLDDFVVV